MTHAAPSRGSDVGRQAITCPSYDAWHNIAQRAPDNHCGTALSSAANNERSEYAHVKMSDTGHGRMTDEEPQRKHRPADKLARRRRENTAHALSARIRTTHDPSSV